VAIVLLIQSDLKNSLISEV